MSGSKFIQIFCSLWIVLIIQILSTVTVAAQTSSFPEVRLYLDVDREFVTKARSEEAAERFVRELVAKVDAIYRSQSGITISVAGIHLWNSDDPFDRTTDSTLLSSFAAYAESNYRGTVSYDAAHLIVGSGMGGEGGIAYPASACGDLISAPYAYGVSQPDITDEYEFNPHLLAHELGHNLGAEHDEFPACRVTNIMCPGQIGGTFSAISVASISAYVSSRQGDGCFAAVERTDPVQAVRLATTVRGNTVTYRITGGSGCTTLTVVGSPSQAGLGVMFGYLQLGSLTPADPATATSRNAPALLTRNSKLHFGVYCDGQLAASKTMLNGRKIRSRRATNSAVLALRALKRTFR